MMMNIFNAENASSYLFKSCFVFLFFNKHKFCGTCLMSLTGQVLQKAHIANSLVKQNFDL